MIIDYQINYITNYLCFCVKEINTAKITLKEAGV